MGEVVKRMATHTTTKHRLNAALMDGQPLFDTETDQRLFDEVQCVQLEDGSRTKWNVTGWIAAHTRVQTKFVETID